MVFLCESDETFSYSVIDWWPFHGSTVHVPPSLASCPACNGHVKSCNYIHYIIVHAKGM